MTEYKVFEMMDVYQARLAEAGYDSPTRTPCYALASGDAKVVRAAGNHLAWMVQEAKSLFRQGRGPKAFRWVGWIQHAMVCLNLCTLEEVKAHAANSDESQFPPPPGMATSQAKMLLSLACSRCGGLITQLARQTWVPHNLAPGLFRFPNIDPDGRLPKLQDVGVRVVYRVHDSVWDYNDQAYTIILDAVMLHPHLTDESVALVVSMLKAGGWGWGDDESKEWPRRWALHSLGGAKDPAKCSPDDQFDAIIGPIQFNLSGQPADDDGPKPRKRKRRRKSDDQGGEDGGK